MDTYLDRITQLQEELAIVRSERDRFKQIASSAEAETLKRRIEYLDLQNDYERERMKRIKLEHSQHTASSSNFEGECQTDEANFQHFSSSEYEDIRNESVEITVNMSAPLKHKGKKKLKAEARKSAAKEVIEIDLDDQPEDMIMSIPQSNESVSPLQESTSSRIEVIPVSIRSFISPVEDDQTEVCSSPKAPFSPAATRDLLDGPAPGHGTSSSLLTVTPSLSLPTPELTPALRMKLPSTSLSLIPDPVEHMKFEDEKGKKEGFTISKVQVSKYLKDAENLAIRPPALHILVSRSALTMTYGLPGMGLIWTSKDKRHQFMTPTYAVNPEMPRSPGAPGLLLSCREEMCKNGPWTLFVKAEGGKKVRLNYAGEYMCKTVGKMTHDEFLGQNPSVKLTWGKKVATSKRHAIYRELRARMTLRKTLGVEPSKDQVKNESENIKKKGYTSSLTSADVVEAFERGEERISIVMVECVSYNHERARQYAEAQKAWEARERVKASAKPGESSTGPKNKDKGRKKLTTNEKSRSMSHKKTVEPEMESEDDADDEVPNSQPILPGPSRSSVQSATPLRSSRERKKSFKLLQMQEELSQRSDESDLTDLGSD